MLSSSIKDDDYGTGRARQSPGTGQHGCHTFCPAAKSAGYMDGRGLQRRRKTWKNTSACLKALERGWGAHGTGRLQVTAIGTAVLHGPPLSYLALSFPMSPFWSQKQVGVRTWGVVSSLSQSVICILDRKRAQRYRGHQHTQELFQAFSWLFLIRKAGRFQRLVRLTAVKQVHFEMISSLAEARRDD